MCRQEDDKILTDWNGLMIAALAKASVTLDYPGYMQAAAKTADFLLTKMRVKTERFSTATLRAKEPLRASWTTTPFMAFGLIELYEATFEDKYLKAANSLNQNHDS